MPDKKLHVYSEDEITAKLAAELPGWYLENGWIRRYYKTDGWPTTLMLVNTLGYLAEAAAHHPDLTVSWAKLWVKLQTHDHGGVTDKDFELAKKIEEVVLWKPGVDSALEGGTQAKWVRGGDPVSGPQS
jgi:4a-hydroxytetrahydrobiopterin dehydratase